MHELYGMDAMSDSQVLPIKRYPPYQLNGFWCIPDFPPRLNPKSWPNHTNTLPATTTTTGGGA
eukprot:9265338-Karenia_brevis.AAC.1